MKRFFLISLGICLVISLMGCTKKQKLDAPENIAINGDVLSWDQVDNAINYQVKIVNSKGNEQTKIVATNSLNLFELNLQPNKYTIYIQALGGKDFMDSDLSTENITYEVVKELKEELLLAEQGYIKWQGRTSYDQGKRVNMMYHSSSSFEVKFIGTSITIILYATKYSTPVTQPYYVLIINDDYENRQRVALTQDYTIISLDIFPTSENTINTLTLYKSTESIDSHIGLNSISTNGRFIKEVNYKDRLIEFIAASSSTGYGNLSKDGKTTSNSDALQAFSYLTARDLNADLNIYAASGWGVKASRWTGPHTLNMFDAYKKVDFFSEEIWDQSKIQPDVIVINLGTNDWSYINMASTQEERNVRMQAFKDQYVAFLDYLHTSYPTCKIIMLYGLMRESNIYNATIEIYDRAKVTNPGLAILKVEGDAGGANSHPSLACHRLIADLLVEKIKSEMGW